MQKNREKHTNNATKELFLILVIDLQLHHARMRENYLNFIQYI